MIENSLLTHFRQIQQNTPRKTLRGALIELMPQRLVDIILKKAGIEDSLVMNQLDKESRQRLMDKCVHYPLDVTGVLGYSKAEVTAGGIDWAEINPKTVRIKISSRFIFCRRNPGCGWPHRRI